MRRVTCAGLLLVGLLAVSCGGTTASSNGGAGTGGASGAGGSSGSAGVGGGAGSGGVSGSGGAAGAGGATGYCPDYSLPPAGSQLCRSQSECQGGQECIAPGESFPNCGACMMPDRACETSADCTNGQVCVEYDAPCSCTGGRSSKCVAPCTNTSCNADQRCDASSGLCKPTPCNDGYACPTDWRCAAGAASTDAHGCEPVPCDQGYTCPENTRCKPGTGNHGCSLLSCQHDSECDCGACVKGHCVAGPGTCEYLAG